MLVYLIYVRKRDPWLHISIIYMYHVTDKPSSD